MPDYRLWLRASSFDLANDRTARYLPVHYAYVCCDKPKHTHRLERASKKFTAAGTGFFRDQTSIK